MVGWIVQTGILVMIAVIALLTIGAVGFQARGAEFGDESQ